MSKDAKTYDLFAQIEVPPGVEPRDILKVMEAAALKEAWGFVGAVENEDALLKASMDLSNLVDEEDE